MQKENKHGRKIPAVLSAVKELAATAQAPALL
jgi:hypothetical protein